MKTCVLHFNGYPGTGKLTIAKELVAQESTFRLIDNHAINNLIFAMVRLDGRTKISREAWDAIGDIRTILMNFMPEHAAPSLSFVFTNALAENDADDMEVYRSIKEGAEKRGSEYIPVVLTCDMEENKKRIASADREANMKMTSPDDLESLYISEKKLLVPDHPNLMELDVTGISPADAAGRIKAHAYKIMDLQ